MDKKFITKRNYIRSLTCQPFFVWNSIAKNDVEQLDDQDFLDLLWDEDEEIEQSENFGQRIAKTFRLVDDKLVEMLAKKGEIFVVKGSTEEAISQTKSLLSSGKILIAPVFDYNETIAKPFAFDTKTNTIINIKYSLKTKRIDFAKGYYDYAVVSQIIEVKGYELFLPVNIPLKKGQIELIPIDSGWASMTAHFPEESTESKQSTVQNFLKAFKQGCIFTKKSKEGDFVPSSIINFKSIDQIIAYIQDCKLQKNISSNISKDLTPWGFNPEWNELLEKIGSPYVNFSGKVISKKQLVEMMENSDFEEMVLKTPVASLLILDDTGSKEISYPVVNKKFLNEILIIKNSQKVVWYDFEGFSLPIAPLDYVLPYRQVVFQVSVIETFNNNQTRIDNLVVDPKNINLDDFVKIIKMIFRDDVDAYVVYNKSYEISRMNEMLLLLQKANHSEASNFKNMLNDITVKTVDLYNLFSINSPKKVPAVLLPDQKGRSSIKNVEKYITKHKIVLSRLITPYKELSVSNGGMAMSIAIDRALEIIGDKEWLEKVEELKKYCENDVKAMIMVYDFVLKIVGEDVN